MTSNSRRPRRESRYEQDRRWHEKRNREVGYDDRKAAHVLRKMKEYEKSEAAG